MQIGLLWYDDDPRKTLEAKIEQAAARYHEKYGQAPDTCYVNASTAGTEGKKNGVRIVSVRTIRPNYLWIGVDDAAREARRERSNPGTGWIV